MYEVSIFNRFFEDSETQEITANSFDEAVAIAEDLATGDFVAEVVVSDHQGTSAHFTLEPFSVGPLPVRVLLRHDWSGELFLFDTQAANYREIFTQVAQSNPSATLVAIQVCDVTEWHVTPALWWQLPVGWIHPNSRRPKLCLIRGGVA